MSSLVFPSLPGLAWGVKRATKWSSRVQRSASGKRQAMGYAAYPIWTYSLNFAVLRQNSSFSEMAQLEGFFNQLDGQVDTFLFADPADAVATNQTIANGTGLVATYQLVNTFGGFTYPVQAPNIVNLFRSSNLGNDKLSQSTRSNLNLQSQTMDSATWAKTQATVTANASTAPDGTLTADRIVEDTTASVSHFINVTRTLAVGQVYTHSVYAKETGSGSKRYLALLASSAGFGASGNQTATFDLATGTVTFTSGGATAKCVSVGGGWYRCIMTTVAATSASSIGLHLRLLAVNNSSTATYTGDGVSGMDVWGAQFETGTDATTYIPTTTTSVTVGADYTLLANGIIQLGSNLPSGNILSWTGTFYKRCAFTSDIMELVQDGVDIWKSNAINFESVKV